MNNIIEEIRENPVIAAVRKNEDFRFALESGVSAIFLLQADIFNIKEMVDEAKSHHKIVFIHIDFLEGLGRDNKSIDYISRVIKPNGIISTRSNQIKYAFENGMFTIQRFFLVDSLSYNTMIKTVNIFKPDMIEIMPAIMPSVITRTCSEINLPIIAGGLIQNKKDMIDVLKSGGIGVSTGKKELWLL